jgi:hypothetical protein
MHAAILPQTSEQDAAEDLFFGQVVIIVARWFLVLTGGILSLWSAASESQLVTSILLVAALMAMNFLLHWRYLIAQPVNQTLILATSLLDLGIITAIVLLGPGPHGYASPFFVLYYPALLAFAFVFPWRLTAAYAAVALAAYAAASLLLGTGPADVHEFKVLLLRLITLASTAGLGTYYWRIQRARRAAVLRTAR